MDISQANAFASGPDIERSNPYQERISNAVVWHLLVMEDTNDSSLRSGQRITGQFPLQEGRHELSAIIPEGGGFSRGNPLIQWVGGSVETFAFQARLFSEHRDDQTARDKFEELKLLRKPHEPMKRPPLTRFFWGDAIPGGMPCFIQSLGGVEYDDIRPDGSIRGVSLNITLKRYTPFTIERVTTSALERTPTYTVRDGDTYEMIAQRVWGDPMLGVPLRQQNPRYPMKKWAPKLIADLQANETIKLYPRRDLDSLPIRPQSHIFNPISASANDLRRYYFAQRAMKISVVPKKQDCLTVRQEG